MSHQQALPPDSPARPPSRHRRPRIPAEEVRVRMLDQAREMALDAGIGITLEELSMEEVIQHARVPRSSVYRLWPYKGDFVDDLLCYLADPQSYFGRHDMFDPETSEIVRRTIAEHGHLLGSADGRRALLCEVIRKGAAQNFLAVCHSPGWRIHHALIGAIGSTRDSHARARIAAALQRSQTLSGQSIAALFRYIMETLGLRLRDPARTLEHMVTACRAIVQGLAQSHVLAKAARDDADKASLAESQELSSLISNPIPGPGPDGDAEWTLAACAVLSLVDSFLEPDPDFLVPELAIAAANGQKTGTKREMLAAAKI